MRTVCCQFLLVLCLAVAPARAQWTGRWPGVDESVVERVAAENGRHAAHSFIEGDLLLFAFLMAGLLAGCVVGWCGRQLFVENLDRDTADDEP